MNIRNFLSKGGIYSFVAVLIALGATMLGFSMTSAESTKTPVAGEHVITLHDDGVDKGFYTKAKTLREALKNAGVRLDANDRAEPSLDSKLIAASYEVNIYRARPVLIRDGGAETRVISAYRTPEQIAQNAGITLHDEDTTDLAPSRDVVADGASEIMTITRATAFTFVFYGKTSEAYTQEKTVGAMLERKNIKLGSSDTVEPGASTPITPGMTIKLWRNGVQTLTQEEDVAFTTRQVKDANQEIGYKQVQTAGQNGKKTVTYEVNMQNGVEVSRKVVNSNMTKQPVEQVEVIGTKFSNTFSGSFGEALARLRSCEGSYTSNTGNGYYGAYQYDIQTWGNYQGYANASLAPPAVQDQKVWETYQRRGWSPWPSCSRSQGLQDIYR